MFTINRLIKAGVCGGLTLPALGHADCIATASTRTEVGLLDRLTLHGRSSSHRLVRILLAENDPRQWWHRFNRFCCVSPLTDLWTVDR